ncbi:transposase-like zinc-binding domain-containing protein [Actinobacillus porcitonsillarum]
MKYEQNNCPFCQSTRIKKYSTSNNIQRYFVINAIKHLPSRIN